MTEQQSLDLDAIQARANAATSQPWIKHANLLIGGVAIYPPGAELGTGNEVADFVSDADAEFIAHARTDVPALIAEVERQAQVIRDGFRSNDEQRARAERAEAQRDENLANVRRIDDLRIADTARLQAELDATQTDNERLRASEEEWENSLGRLEAELHRIAERFPPEGYPDGDVEWSIRQHGPVAALEQITHLIGKQQDELRAAQTATRLADATVALHLAQETNLLDYRDAYRTWRDALSAYLAAKGLGTGEFCERHFSWLCAAGQGRCQRDPDEAGQ